MTKITAIIMAAGVGSRIGDLMEEIPKPLLKINNRPIIEYDINFLRSVGVDEIIIVGGYKFDVLKKEINAIDKSIKVVNNKNYNSGNICSLKFGLNEVRGSGFLLYHADHIYHNDIAKKIKDQLKEDILIFTDNDRKLGNDDMKVKISEDGTLSRVSKKIDDFELGYVGITYCPKRCLDHYKRSLDLVIEEKTDQAVSEDVMQHIADKKDKDIKIGDMSGSIWHEVDDMEDYRKANKIISENYEQYR